jgi:uncharacterized protein (DUF305 family)
MFFMHRIKKTSSVYDKGIEIKDTLEAAKQSYHSYLGAYAYGHDANTDYVSCMITDDPGTVMMAETWMVAAQEESAE